MRTPISCTLFLTCALLLGACGSGGGAAGDDQPGPDPCRVTISGDITIPSVFSNGPEACDYWFPGGESATYRISSDVLIEPGTTLRFGQDALLYVVAGGSIEAVGHPDARITFEAAVPVAGYWYGICFEENRASRLEYVDVRHAGKRWTLTGTACAGGIAGAYPGGEPVTIRNTTVSGSYVSGLSVHDLNLGDFAANAFYGNREFGVASEAKQVHKLDADSDYLGERSGALNGQPFVYAGGHISDPGTDHIWHNLNAPYLTSSDTYDYGRGILVADGTTLVISPGTTIVFDGDTELYVYEGSSLGLAGTPAERITLRGLKPEQGAWNGLHISNSAAILEHVDILWGGRSDLAYTGSLYFAEIGTDPNGKILADVFIDGSANCALVIEHYDRSVFRQLDVTFGANNEQNEC